MANQIMVIVPYWEESFGTWVFDDPSTGLDKEPFISGIPEMIDTLVAEIPNAREGFRLIFSASPFPGYQRRIIRQQEEGGGWWYSSDAPPTKGWLCPALFQYFDAAPLEMYLRAEGMPS